MKLHGSVVFFQNFGLTVIENYALHQHTHTHTHRSAIFTLKPALRSQKRGVMGFVMRIRICAAFLLVTPTVLFSEAVLTLVTHTFLSAPCLHPPFLFSLLHHLLISSFQVCTNSLTSEQILIRRHRVNWQQKSLELCWISSQCWLLSFFFFFFFFFVWLHWKMFEAESL